MRCGHELVEKLLTDHGAEPAEVEVSVFNTPRSASLKFKAEQEMFAAAAILPETKVKTTQDALRDKAASDNWAISRPEVELGKVISHTFKSTVLRASWRGTQVVVKLAKTKKHNLLREENCQNDGCPTSNKPASEPLCRGQSDTDSEEEDHELIKDELLPRFESLLHCDILIW